MSNETKTVEISVRKIRKILKNKITIIRFFSENGNNIILMKI